MADKYVKVSGLEGLEAGLAFLEQKTARAHQGVALFEGAKVLERGVKEWIKAWHLIDTNTYRNSITAAPVSNDMAVVFSAIIYGPIHEFGGTIKPKRKPFLVFKIGKQWIRASSVTIPARPHWRPAVNTKSSQIIKAIAKALSLSCEQAAAKGRAAS